MLNRQQQGKEVKVATLSLPNFKQKCSKIGIMKRGFGFIKRVFCYRNKWSYSGPEDFGLVNADMLPV